jgi:hypothetical protein
MTTGKWKSRTKRDLMIEVWEALDCESVGAIELEEIERAVRETLGDGAVQSHASVARILADEGAELRHAEVLELDVKQRTTDPYKAIFNEVVNLSDLQQAVNSFREMENLRQQFESEGNVIGLQRLRDSAMKSKQRMQAIAADESVAASTREEKREIAEWFIVWLKQPEIFENWLELRFRSKEFQERFSQ